MRNQEMPISIAMDTIDSLGVIFYQNNQSEDTINSLGILFYQNKQSEACEIANLFNSFRLVHLFSNPLYSTDWYLNTSS